MEKEDYALKDPGRLMTEVAERVTLQAGTAWLVHVEDADDTQEIISIEPLVSGVTDGWETASHELRDLVERWQVPPVPPLAHRAVVIGARRGVCAFGIEEVNWHLAWRYSHQLQPLGPCDVLVVTEHGWGDVFGHVGANEPAITAR